MFQIQHRVVEANGIRMHVAEQGEGPVVILCHGFPESWYSWRHQLSALAQAGFRAVAPDMRGYGETERPDAIDRYTFLHMAGDMVALLTALGGESAVIVGHDMGALVAWLTAQIRPDLFRGVVALSVPFMSRGQTYPSRQLPETDNSIFYQNYFQTVGIAEAEFERDVRSTIRKWFCSLSGDALPAGEVDWNAGEGAGMVPRDGGFLSNIPEPATLPPWLSEADVDVYVEQFARTGFGGALNWYRNSVRNWELLAFVEGLKVAVPALFIAGDHDAVLGFRGMDSVIDRLPKEVPLLQRTIIFPGCGHSTQQERPQEVSDAIIAFLKSMHHQNDAL